MRKLSRRPSPSGESSGYCGCLTVTVGGFVSRTIGLGRTIVRWERPSLTTGSYVPSGCTIPLGEKPSQTRLKRAPRGALRFVSSVRTLSPSEWRIQTEIRSRVRSRNRMCATRLSVPSGEKSGSTLVEAIGDLSSLAPSVIANATAVAASRAWTNHVDRTRATSRGLYVGSADERPHGARETFVEVHARLEAEQLARRVDACPRVPDVAGARRQIVDLR